MAALKIHVMLGHAQAVDRRKRFAAGESRHEFGGISDRHGGSMGNAQPRRAPADQAGDVAEHVGKQHVLAAENVAPADGPVAQRCEMSVGDVVDMNKIEPGVDEARHAAARRLDDDAAGGRRAHVAGADRRRGIDDDGRQSIAGHHRLDQSFGGDLAALVGADTLLFREWDGFVPRRAVVRPAERGDARGIDHALDAGAQRLLHHIACAVDIGGIDRAGVACPQAVVGRDMKDVTDAAHCPLHRVYVAEIAGDELQIEPVEVKAGTGLPHQRAHRETGLEQSSRHRRSDKAAGSGDQDCCRGAHAFSLSDCTCISESSILTMQWACSSAAQVYAKVTRESAS